MPNTPKAGRAARLLRLFRQSLDEGELCRELGCSPQELDRYRSGQLEIPMEKQTRFALLLIERTPYVRKGRLLLAQVRAAKAYHARETEVHLGPPARAHHLEIARPSRWPQ